MLFEAEYKQVLELKKSVIKQAVENGVATSSTLQMITSRLDAKIEDLALYLAHAGQNFAVFKEMAEKAASAAVGTACPPPDAIDTVEAPPQAPFVPREA